MLYHPPVATIGQLRQTSRTLDFCLLGHHRPLSGAIEYHQALSITIGSDRPPSNTCGSYRPQSTSVR
ncbi:hypothetical protein E1A91_D11G240500v1 [Gossypium mustelinum]|uniref:Uncharacterized protein n=5 Tax=Gossypium TaxID=3633 RepID=A0A5D2SX06_GOSMU|nr:hypothetical protein B456_007G234200 [Gossypium raimondii]MBA0618410.1 hypothetical protein [Gossypium davidsonii]TYH45163.1 hypothetical protein ES332_D11G245700v1 [Gossypium tomentosum]TYI56845.1 hypothetical protein E1A91_D11G240500v1 [Gossypium mustelinum]TYI56846.1 hypothetical protein E1A91_D11G240500v1 [Gossypium mustelinum]